MEAHERTVNLLCIYAQQVFMRTNITYMTNI